MAARAGEPGDGAARPVRSERDIYAAAHLLSTAASNSAKALPVVALRRSAGQPINTEFGSVMPRSTSEPCAMLLSWLLNAS